MAYEPATSRRSCLGLFAAAMVGTFSFYILDFAMTEASFSQQSLATDLFGMTVLSLLVGAGPATVLVGLPTYFLLRGRVRPNPLLCGLVGAVIGTTPMIFWVAVAANEFAVALDSIAACAASGMFGGLAFWLIARRELNDEYETRQANVRLAD